MIYFVSGEPYQAKQFITKLKSQKIQEGFEWYSFDQEEMENENQERRLSELLRGKSLFNKNKIIQLRIADHEFIKIFLKNNEEIIKDDIFIFFAPRQKEFAIKSSKYIIKHFRLPMKNQLKEFIIKEFHSRNVNPSIPVISSLMSFERSLTDLYFIVNEIEKISLAPAKFQELALPYDALNPFYLTDALMQKDKSKTLLFLEKEISNRTKPLDIVNRILWQTRVLILVATCKPQSAISKLPFHPFVIKKASQACRLFSLSDIKSIYLKTISLYESLLFSSLPPELLLSQFFLLL